MPKSATKTMDHEYTLVDPIREITLEERNEQILFPMYQCITLGKKKKKIYAVKCDLCDKMVPLSNNNIESSEPISNHRGRRSCKSKVRRQEISDNKRHAQEAAKTLYALGLVASGSGIMSTSPSRGLREIIHESGQTENCFDTLAMDSGHHPTPAPTTYDNHLPPSSPIAFRNTAHISLKEEAKLSIPLGVTNSRRVNVGVLDSSDLEVNSGQNSGISEKRNRSHSIGGNDIVAKRMRTIPEGSS